MKLFEVLEVYQDNQTFRVIVDDEIVIHDTSLKEVKMFGELSSLSKDLKKLLNKDVKKLHVDKYCLAIGLKENQ